MLLITWAEILHQRVLKHAIGVGRFQIYEKEAKRTLRHVLQHLFYLLWRVAPRYFLDDRLSFQPVRQGGPNEQGREVNTNNVCYGPEFLGSYPQISSEMAAPDRKSRYDIVVRMHQTLIVNHVIEYPEALRISLCFAFFAYSATRI